MVIKKGLFLWAQIADVYTIYLFATFDIYYNICKWEFCTFLSVFFLNHHTINAMKIKQKYRRIYAIKN